METKNNHGSMDFAEYILENESTIVNIEVYNQEFQDMARGTAGKYIFPFAAITLFSGFFFFVPGLQVLTFIIVLFPGGALLLIRG